MSTSFAIVALLLASRPGDAAIEAPASVVDGMQPGIRVVGLAPGEVIRLHALRSLEKWQSVGGEWKRTRQAMHAWADFAASAAGDVEVDAATPIRGSYGAADPLGLLRTGYRAGDPALRDVTVFPLAPLESAPAELVHLKLETKGELRDEKAFTLLQAAPEVLFDEVFQDGWHAVYARPKERDRLRAVISLHGSEGGSVAKARGRAAQFASRGFAALAVNYFAYDHEKIRGVPIIHDRIALEVLERAHAWLRERPEVDGDHVALHGVSKGAEFALLGATRFRWATAIVAVVPSDVVWEGYRSGGAERTASSSWSEGGRPLPFVPLFPFDPKNPGEYRTNTERYERSRAAHPELEAQVRIPIEETDARVLLLGSDRDEVWASGAMARKLAAAMEEAGKGDRVECVVYPRAGHQIAGTGTFPIRLYGEPSADPEAKDLVAEGEAAADAWARTIRFLER